MSDAPIKVLIVEDSRSTALALQRLLAPFDVVGVAADGAEALRLVDRLSPDVVTMDIHLPDSDGVELTRQILAKRRIPIIIISAMVSPDRQRLVFEALRAGAYEVVAKSKFFSQGSRADAGRRLPRLIRAAAGRPPPPRTARARRARPATASSSPASPPRPADPRASPPQPAEQHTQRRRRIVAVGGSTGGPAVLRSALAELPADYPLPIVVAQHMAEGFIEGFVRWLDAQCRVEVRVAQSDDRLRPATVYFPPSLHDLSVGADGQLQLESRGDSGLAPSVDRLFASVADAYGDASACLLLTGMGSDGAVGMRIARDRGAATAVQDEESSVVFGMPKAALERGGTDVILPASAIGGWLRGQAR